MRIDTDLAILGNGEIIKNASICIEKNLLTFVGEQEHAPSDKEILTAPVVTPGFWDCHAHFFGLKKFDYEENLLDPMVKIMRCTWDLKELLSAGVTSVREVGGYGIHLRRSIAENTIPGPRIYAAGNMISMTGGHGDIHDLLPEIVPHAHLGSRITSPIANGVAECQTKVRTLLRAGAEIIKFAASGGVMSQVDSPKNQQYSLEEQKAIVEEATRAKVSVAAHCYGEEGIKSALEAGDKTIEHGTYLTVELADLMIEKNAILVPTTYVYKGLFDTPEAKEKTPEYAYQKSQEILKTHMNMLRMAIKKGVTIAMGTDLIVTGPYHPIYKYGDNLRDLSYMVEAGMSPMDAIVAGTGNGPKTLGLRQLSSGQLQVGFDADLVLFKKSPLDDISILTNKTNVVHVIKQGTIVV